MKSLPVFTDRASIPILSRAALIFCLAIASATVGPSCSKSEKSLPVDTPPEVREQIECIKEMLIYKDYGFMVSKTGREFHA
jgi:hypothetical protein